MLCPEISEFKLSGGYKGAYSFHFHVDWIGEESDKEFIDKTIVMSSMVNRYFTPSTYNDLGYMPFTTALNHYIELF